MRTTAPPLLPMFRSEMQLELLGLVLLQPDRPWTLGALGERLSAPASSIHRELLRLVDAGLVTRDGRKRPHEYRAALETPAYRPLRDLLELTTGVPAKLEGALREFRDIRAAAVHGGWAAGKVRPDSDIDVIVVTESSRDEVQRALRRVGRSVGRDVDPSVLTESDFQQLVRARNPFLGKILHGPRIDVVGSLDDLVA
jgi:predicted nucleotidyltransferase